MTNIDISPEAVERLDAALASQIGDDISVVFNHESLFKRSRGMISALSAALTKAQADAAKATAWAIEQHGAADRYAAALTEYRVEAASAYERAAQEADRIENSHLAANIRALATPDQTAARDQMIAKAEARGMRKAAAIAEKGVKILGLRMREAKNKKEKLNWQSMLFCAVDIKQAILDAIPKGGDA